MINREKLFSLTRQLVDIPSPTGQEAAVAAFVYDLLSDHGWKCERQNVSGDRFNVTACKGQPRILLTTHLDTVPPFIPSAEDDLHVYGRGSCDAKGIAAAMICAAEELTAEGRSDVGLLFVVGEETDSDGAIRAGRDMAPVVFLINGEPTDNELAIGHKGLVLARIKTTGRAAHSAYPERGDSAILKLLEVLRILAVHEFPVDPLLGKAHVNIGAVAGGVAANVIPDAAEALILIRTVGPSAAYLEDLNRICGEISTLSVIKTSEPQKMVAVEGFPQKVVGYGTDIPALRCLGQPLLFGPGSILDAHAVHEKIDKKELQRAVDLYKSLVQRLGGMI